MTAPKTPQADGVQNDAAKNKPLRGGTGTGAVKRLGIDVKKWAGAIRQRVSAADDADRARVMIRPLRGQVVIREKDVTRTGILWHPAPGQKQVKTHRGTVLAMGPPARDKWGNEIAPGFRVGDEVSYHWEMNEEAHTRVWPSDGLPASWVRQYAVDGVWVSDAN